MKRLVIGPLLALFTIASAPAAAQEALGDTAESGRKMEDGREGKGPTGFIALGPGATPAYDGAKSYQLIPFGIADLRWKGMEFELRGLRSEEHTSELQSLMRISYAVFCLTKKNNKT